MSKNDRKTPFTPNLSQLIEKFTQNDVIAEMEKEYQSAPARLVNLSSLKDNEIIGQVKMAPRIVEYFASTIKEKGIFNPLVVRPVESGYEVVLGRKRFLGAKQAGIVSVPCVIKEMGDEEELLMLLADNRDQRESNIIEMALICQALQQRFHYTQQTLASLSHQSRCQITNTLRLLSLTPKLQNEVSLGELSYGHAKAIASLKGNELEETAETIRKERLSVRETEALVKSKKHRTKAESRVDLAKKVGATKMKIKGNSVRFEFPSETERDRFIEVLRRK